MTDTDLKHICKLKQLEELTVFVPEWSAAGVSAIAALPNLSSLSLHHCAIDERMAKTLTGAPALTSLSISCTGLADASIRQIFGMRRLERLRLSAQRFDMVNRPLDRPQTKLRELALTEITECDDTLFANLRIGEMVGLEVLELDRAPVTDKSIKLCARLPQLKKLSCNHTKVTFAGLVELRYCPQLESLNCRGVPLSKEDVQRLCEALPGAFISSDSGGCIYTVECPGIGPSVRD